MHGRGSLCDCCVSTLRITDSYSLYDVVVRMGKQHDKQKGCLRDDLSMQHCGGIICVCGPVKSQRTGLTE